jgi:hypothetical protein
MLAGGVRASVEKPVAPHAATEVTVAVRPGVIDTAAALIDEPLGDPQFNTTPTPLPPNIAGVSFEGNATSEFGSLVRLAGPTHFIDSVTIAMSSQAIRSDFPRAPEFGFTHPITLKLYAVDRSSGTPVAGAVLANVTKAFLIPWRPEPDASSASPSRPWRASDGNLYPGIAFTVTFDLGALALSLPNEVIVGISFNTEHYGASPLGVSGPYNFLHVGVSNLAPSFGTNPERDAVFWKTATATSYSDGGAAGVNVFRRDTRWSGYQLAVRINDSPYGMLSSLATTLRNVPSDDVPTIMALVEASDLTSAALERSLWDGNDRLRPLWGRLVFDLLAEAADQLTRFANTENAITPHARAALDSLLAAAQTLAETAVGDAVIAGGTAERVARAQEAFDTASLHERGEHFDRAISQLATAWREAELSLR